MLRADYCGDGTPHTRDGTPVDVYDTVGIQLPEPGSGLSFEAAWRTDGAVCVRKVRIPEIITLDALVQLCPARLRNHVGPECIEEGARQLGRRVQRIVVLPPSENLHIEVIRPHANAMAGCRSFDDVVAAFRRMRALG